MLKSQKFRIWLYVVLIKVGFFLAFLGWSVGAEAHEGWEWIRNEPRYLAPQGYHCCSNDCKVEDPHKFKVDEDGITYEGKKLFFNDPGIYTSADPKAPNSDQKWWRCKSGENLNCIFRPAFGGM